MISMEYSVNVQEIYQYMNMYMYVENIKSMDMVVILYWKHEFDYLK